MSDGRWTAVVLAGERPGETAFADAHGVASKALIPVAGEPMLVRVVQTLLESAPVGRILILAQRPERLLRGTLAWMSDDERIAAVASGDGISTSIAEIAGSPQAPFPFLVTTADHALLSRPMIETFVDRVGESDAAFAVVERGVVEAVYPETKRTWLRFSDGDVTGANLFALRTEAARKGLEIWASVEKDRKKAVKLMLSFGPILALRALTRTISLDAVLTRIGQRVGMTVRAVRLPFAEAAIDVDKEADLLLANRIFAERGQR